MVLSFLAGEFACPKEEYSRGIYVLHFRYSKYHDMFHCRELYAILCPFRAQYLHHNVIVILLSSALLWHFVNISRRKTFSYHQTTGWNDNSMNFNQTKIKKNITLCTFYRLFSSCPVQWPHVVFIKHNVPLDHRKWYWPPERTGSLDIDLLITAELKVTNFVKPLCHRSN